MFLHFLWWVCGGVKGTVDPVNVIQCVAVMWETEKMYNETEPPSCCGCWLPSPKVKEKKERAPNLDYVSREVKKKQTCVSSPG